MHLKPQPKSECFLPHSWQSPHKKIHKSLPKAAKKGSSLIWNKAEFQLPLRRCRLINQSQNQNPSQWLLTEPSCNLGFPQKTCLLAAEQLCSWSGPQYRYMDGYRTAATQVGSSPGAELPISLCWTSWGSCLPIPQAYPGASEWQHKHQVYQLPILHHLQNSSPGPINMLLIKRLYSIGPSTSPTHWNCTWSI